MKTKSNVGGQVEYTALNLVWDVVFIVVCIFCALALFLALPTDAHAAGSEEIGRWRASLALVDADAPASDAQARYAPNFGRNLTAGSVGNTLAQPVQPGTPGIHGAANQIRIGF